MSQQDVPGIFGRIIAAAIYIGLAVVGAVLFFWGFLFAVGAAVAMVIFFLFMRLFGLAPNKRHNPFARGGEPFSENTGSSDATIELKKKSDGTYE